ncbi:hypothetical protein DSO57_1029526 [Entomophthora muscae]|uniref:Uncharacterized protein n=1 Tax=Entomophthora muscae TaxID=34485 RepID=A0ACC2SE85_9FUNG|nr:hypothetical protein DSO57_1029526 [Entomophthora muscae]
MNQEGGLELGSIESLAHRLLGDFPDEYIGFAAPEILQNRFSPSIPTLASDIYSVGIILGSIWCSALPYASRIKREFVLKGGKPDWIHQLPQVLAPIITLCLHFKPSSRPSAVRLLTTLENVFSNDPFPSQVVVRSAAGFGESEESLCSIPPQATFSMKEMSSALMACTRASGRRSCVLPKSPHGSIGRSLSLRSVDGRPLIDQALSLHAKGEHERAFKCFVQVAELEADPIANYHLGVYYYYGKYSFAVRNIPRALEHLEAAAKSNYGEALDLLGLYYLDPKLGNCDHDLAILYFQKAAEMGSPAGTFHLSQCYQRGHGTECQPDLAAHALHMAADLGHGPAIARLESR